MKFHQTFRIGKFVALGTALSWAFMILTTPLAIADHVSAHATACNEPDTVGGGLLGVSINPATPSGLGWDVGSGQCNGSFVVTRDPSFPSTSGGGIELGLRIEQRRVGQITRQAGNEYIVETGADPTSSGLRTWWNYHISIAYDGTIVNLKSLTLTIENLAGPNDPSLPVFDLLPFCGTGGARNGGGAGTAQYGDICQFSQNPEFGAFVATPDNDANPDGDFDYDAEGIWRFKLEAKPQSGGTVSVSMCVRTRNAAPLDNSVSACVGSESKKKKKKK